MISNARHWCRRGEIEIEAPVCTVYAQAVDPAVVPSYALDIARITVLERRGSRALVRSDLRVAGFVLPAVYEYRYRANRSYAGLQTRGIVRGFFGMSFSASPGGTRVRHVEGIISTVPFLASLCGAVFFGLFHRGSVEDELARLRQIVESPPSSNELRYPTHRSAESRFAAS